jgi:WD40 repeat protein
MPERPIDEDTELDEVIAAYLAAEDDGRPSSPSELLAAHPKHQAALSKFLAGHLELSNLAKANWILPVSNPFLFKPGTIFAGYEILAIAGTGGTAVVYRAHQTEPNRVVALKVLTPDPNRPSEAAGRFRAEAAVLAKLNHPGIAPVFEFGESEGHLYLATEWFPGGSLQDQLSTIRLRPRVVAALVRDLARAVAHAHGRGVIHRDLKPSNVLFDADGHPKLVDFGFAYEEDRPLTFTRTGEVSGTPVYMAPEQAGRSKCSITMETDVHGLGACLYAGLTGRAPFAGSDLVDVLVAVVQNRPLSAKKLNPLVPRDLSAVCDRCLEKEPAARYRSAAELADELDRFLSGRPTVARPPTVARRVALWMRRRPATAATMALLAAAMTTTGAAVVLAAIADAKSAASAAQAKASADLAESNQFFTVLERIRIRRAEPKVGWTQTTLGEIRALAALTPAIDHLVELRSEAAFALGGLDLRRMPDMATDFRGYAVANHPFEPLLVVTEWPPNHLGLSTEVRVYDTRTDTIVKKFNMPADTTWQNRTKKGDMGTSVGVSPDGAWLAVGCRRGRVHVWNWSGGSTPVVTHQGHKDSVEQIAFTETSRTLFTLSDDHAEYMAFVRDRGWAAIGPQAHRDVYFPAVVPAALDITANDLKTGSMDLVQHCRTRLPVPEKVLRGRYTPDGKGFLFPESESHFELFLPPFGKTVGQFDFGADPTALGGPIRFAFSVDGHIMTSTREMSNRLVLWDMAAFKPTFAAVPLGGGSCCPVFDCTGRRVYVSGNNRVVALDIAGLDVQSYLDWGASPIKGFDVSIDGKSRAVITTYGDRSVGKIGVRWTCDDVVRTPIEFEGGMFSAFALTRTGVAVHYWAGENDNNDYIAFFGDVKHIRRMSVEDVQTSPAGDVWVSSGDHRVFRFDSTCRNIEATWTNDPNARSNGITVQRIAPDDDGCLLGRRDGKVIAIDRSGKMTAERQVFDGPITAVAVRPGRPAIAGDLVGKLFFLSRPGLEITRTISDAHADAVTAASFSPTGLLATGSLDRTVRLWTPMGEPILVLNFLSAVRNVKFTCDGRELLVLVQGEHALRRWRLDRLAEGITNLGLDPGFSVPAK